jgi:hypothetical protein
MSLRNRKDGGSLRRIFGREVSSSAFQVVDEETRIVGKFAQIALLEDGLIDIWLVGFGTKPLSTRKLTHIIKMFPQEARLTILTGEAYCQVQDENIVIKSLSLLGIRKKRKLYPEVREKLILRLKTPLAVQPPVSTCLRGKNDECQTEGLS